jgi:hypothetical protein
MTGYSFPNPSSIYSIAEQLEMNEFASSLSVGKVVLALMQMIFI